MSLNDEVGCVLHTALIVSADLYIYTSLTGHRHGIFDADIINERPMK